MTKFSELLRIISEKHGSVLDLNKNPEILMNIISDLRIHDQQDISNYPAKNVSPFGVPWMDSWAANWILHQQPVTAPVTAPETEFKSVIRQLTDLKFKERLNEIRKFIIDHDRFTNEPPDGGPPEPGTPPAGPSSFFGNEPPDGGPPEPGTPPAGPSSFFTDEPPDGGTPEPGVPPDPNPPGPDSGILRDNPWILYWFVSINTPLILDMIDAHFTRRMNEYKQQIGK
jgi:hypothetical protein